VPTTARDICVGALRRIGKIGNKQSVDADLARDVLEALNSLMHAFTNRGLSYTHTALTLNDPFPLGEHHNQGVIAILAHRISDDYAPEAVTPKLARDVNDGWAALRKEFFNIPKSRFDIPGSC